MEVPSPPPALGQISDGASAVVVCNEEGLRKLGGAAAPRTVTMVVRSLSLRRIAASCAARVAWRGYGGIMLWAWQARCRSSR